ncbi:SCP2 sterol-binding domain-containing protein [Picrophilus oshimae]|uniref:SCP-2 sterol transfer family protein n=1 Tax=Picrophilus torridus (strain ATCC 700027 / DSM 9790 / JCM 10055 / NBRC 100828 / KAW 2/3) TaxID=1122961 RepID=A0A8G2FW30_PICTO|nr:SCP2 sterol-binding domain-containing protein [Picrophilus oshimae]SMD30548.1 SCP-2 sterol transfer family protein [Picrophilus oshimae DSM 9789]
MKETLQELVDKANNKIKDDPKYADKLKNVNKTITITFDDKETYHFKVENGHITNPEEGKVPADIEVSVSSENFKKILNKEMNAMDAYLNKKIIIKSSLMDKLLLSDLLK